MANSVRNYSSQVPAKTLSSNITSSATTMTLSDLTGLPSAPYTLVIDPDTVNEEIVTVTGISSGTTVNVIRGEDGGAGVAHNSGVTIKHMITGRDLQEAQDHVQNTTTAHGVTGAVVGTTNSQELTNKTLGSGSSVKVGTTLANNGTISGGTVNATTLQRGGSNVITVSDNVITSANIVDGTIVDADISSSAAIASTKISGTAATLTGAETLTNKTINLTSNTLTGTVAQFNTALSGDDFVTLTGVETLTNKTLTTPSLTNPTITGTTGGITAGNKLVIQSGGSIDVASGGTISFGTVGQITANSLTVNALEISYLDGVTSAIQTQLDSKAPKASPVLTGTVDTTGATIALGTNASAITANSKTISATELSLLDGLDDTGWVTTGATVGTGFTATYRYRRFLNIVTIFVQATRTGATITNANVAGDITDTTVLTIPTGYYPSAIGSIIWDVATPAGAGNVGVGTISTAGVMKINALNDEDSQIAANDVLTALVTYIL